MSASYDLAWVIAANVGVINEAGQSREQRCDDSEEHCVKGTAQQTWHFRKSQANEIEQETQDKKSNWKMNQHRMNRMPQRFAFEKIFQQRSPIPVAGRRRRL